MSAPKMNIPSVAELEKLLRTAEAGDSLKLAWLPDLIDHTLLKADASRAQLRALCQEARQHKFGAVCVNPAHVAFCVKELAGSSVKVAAVVGFPLGNGSTRAKVVEAKDVIKNGAKEIDMVLQVGLLKERDLRAVYLDIRKVVHAAGDVPVKVILETSLLDREEKLLASAVAKSAGAAFLKTSTGFQPGGATVEDVALLRSVAKSSMGVKASGGVRTQVDALKMVLAGADRIGTSNGVALVSGTSAGAGATSKAAAY